VRDFDGGVELRPSGWDKGQTIRLLRSEHPAGAAVAFAGDDLTDEDAFQALGAAGLSVLVRSELRPTAADIWLRPPDELLDFLQNWTRSC
jgi:trehalose-phosphatase